MPGSRTRKLRKAPVRRATPTEAALISRYFVRPGRGRRDVIVGIGDDAAVTRLAAGHELVTATDTLAEGVHFPLRTPADALGWRCLAVNLSDLAAMGAEPLWATLALSLPAADAAWLGGFSRGLFRLADRFGVALIGGDTIRGPLVVTVTVHGRVKRGASVERRGAQPGDGVYVTGTLGDAVAGRRLLGSRKSARDLTYLRRRFLYPEPRVGEGARLAALASAMIDVSDGLHDDAGKLMRASGCGALLDAGRIPLSRQLAAHAGAEAARKLALTGGDDYELLFTVPPALEGRLRRLSGRWHCPVTRLGAVTAVRGILWQLGGKRFDFVDQTFRHFG